MKNLSSLLLLTVIYAFGPKTSAPAASLLVNQISPYNNYGYGLSQFTAITTALNNSFGAANITLSSNPLNDLNYLMSFDALWLTPRGPDLPLSALEVNNVATFVASGRRVALIGENDNWLKWNISILQAVGGSYGGGTMGVTHPILVHPLTAGITTWYAGNDGTAIGGTPLFDYNVATLWGASQNALTYLNLDMLSDDSTSASVYYNAQVIFRSNLANWLAAPVPEPTTGKLMTLALLGNVALRRKIKAKIV